MKAAIATLIIFFSLSTVSNAQVSCGQIGNFTFCDNGQHFQNNQGNSSQQQGNGSDTSTYQHYNKFPYGSDGTTNQQNSNFTYGSNGTPCQRIGQFTYCSN